MFRIFPKLRSTELFQNRLLNPLFDWMQLLRNHAILEFTELNFRQKCQQKLPNHVAYNLVSQICCNSKYRTSEMNLNHSGQNVCPCNLYPTASRRSSSASRKEKYSIGALCSLRTDASPALYCVKKLRQGLNRTTSAATIALGQFYDEAEKGQSLLQVRSREIRRTNFHDNLTDFSDIACFQLFLFQRNDIIRENCAVSWPEDRRKTTRNCYQVTLTLKMLHSSAPCNRMQIGRHVISLRKPTTFGYIPWCPS